MPVPSLLLDSLSLICIVSFLLSGVVALLPPPAGSAQTRACEARRRLLLPLGGALVTVGLGFWPAIRAALGGPPDHCETVLSAVPHLCWVHPMASGGAAHDAVVVVLLVTLGGLAFWQAFQWAQAQGRLNFLKVLTRATRAAEVRRRLAEANMAWPGEIQVIAIGLPLCFVSGLLRPRLVLSDLLLDTLPAADVQAIVAHELAHVGRRDNWWRAVGQLAMLMHLPGLGQRAYRRWVNAAEAACDEVASQRMGSPILVAEALVRFQRLINQRGLAHGVPAQKGAAFAEREGVEARVRLLLEAPSSRPVSNAYWLGAAIALGLWQADALHLVLERLLELLHG